MTGVNGLRERSETGVDLMEAWIVRRAGFHGFCKGCRDAWPESETGVTSSEIESCCMGSGFCVFAGHYDGGTARSQGVTINTVLSAALAAIVRLACTCVSVNLSRQNRSGVEAERMYLNHYSIKMLVGWASV